MTSKERLLAAIKHEQADTIPVSPRVGYWLMEYYGEEYVRKNNFEAHLRAGKEFDFDPHFTWAYFPQFIVDVHPEKGDEYEEWLESVSLLGFKREKYTDYDIVSRKIKTPAGILTDKIKIPHIDAKQYGMSPNPLVIEYLIKEKEDVEKVMFLLINPDKKKADLKKQFDEKLNMTGENGLLEIFIRSPLDHRAGDAYSMENMMMDYYRNKHFLTYLLRRFQDECTLKETKAYLEAGAKVIFASWFYASLSAGWSPQIFQELFVPLIKEHVDLVHSYGAYYEYYDDGKVMPIIKDLKECGIDILTTLCPPPMGDVDLKKVKEDVGDKVCLHGGIDLLNVVKEGTPELIERKVKEAIESAGPDGFILGTSDSIRDGTPLENVKAFFAAGRKYGKML